MYTISPEDPANDDAQALIDELSDTLAGITGDSGKSSFDPGAVRSEYARFVVARDLDGRAVGCGAIRPLHDGIAELKRMYARPDTSGVGSAVLAYLEAGKKHGYSALWLETRLVNRRRRFYERRGYTRIGIRQVRRQPQAVCRESGCSLSYTALLPVAPGHADGGRVVVTRGELVKRCTSRACFRINE